MEEDEDVDMGDEIVVGRGGRRSAKVSPIPVPTGLTGRLLACRCLSILTSLSQRPKRR